MNIYRYSEWDGTQDQVLDEEQLMDELFQRLMSGGDLDSWLWRMQRDGLRDSGGKRVVGIQNLLQQLRQRRQSQLDRYKLGSVMDEIRRKLGSILKTEKEGIQRRLDDAHQKVREGTDQVSPDTARSLLRRVEDRAAGNLKKLNNLPEDIGGKIKELTKYDFMDEEARRQFQELMDMLKKHALSNYVRDMRQQLRDMDASAVAGIRNLVEAINLMLEQRMRGEEPDFKSFLEQFGDYFGPNPPQNLDELMDLLQDRMAQAQALLDSLSEEDRQALEELLRSSLDEGTRRELAKLSANLQSLDPDGGLQRRYLFTGEESISYQEALKLMEKLQKMDELESQLKDSQDRRSLDAIDREMVKELVGDEAAEELERIRNMVKMLEEAGYVQKKDNKYELTPRGMRKIGQKALRDVFAQLVKDRVGGHSIKKSGTGNERTDETKRYVFGDEFQLHLQKTIMNSLYRETRKPPVKLSVEDFEVFKTEQLTRTATVLMLDLSLSMPMRGNFEAAKRVAIALDGLIRTQYPRDTLYIVGFSSYARRMKKEDLAYLSWDQFDPYTNMQQGLSLARRLLDKERCSNKQIILISDGEPTAHIEGGNIFFQYPPSLRTLQLTLREVKYCTRKGIVINTFMLENEGFLSAFVSRMARVNKGRVFFTSAHRLGQYILLDYISGKRKGVR